MAQQIVSLIVSGGISPPALLTAKVKTFSRAENTYPEGCGFESLSVEFSDFPSAPTVQRHPNRWTNISNLSIMWMCMCPGIDWHLIQGFTSLVPREWLAFCPGIHLPRATGLTGILSRDPLGLQAHRDPLLNKWKMLKSGVCPLLKYLSICKKCEAAHCSAVEPLKSPGQGRECEGTVWWLGGQQVDPTAVRFKGFSLTSSGIRLIENDRALIAGVAWRPLMRHSVPWSGIVAARKMKGGVPVRKLPCECELQETKRRLSPSQNVMRQTGNHPQPTSQGLHQTVNTPRGLC